MNIDTLYTQLADLGSFTANTYQRNRIPCLTVRDLDTALQKCVTLGCEILQDPLDIDGHTFALIEDPDRQVMMLSVEPSAHCIEVLGAKTNNLRNIDIRLPLNRFTVITGVSGSGKSSLAFDTIYADSRRRFFETNDQIFSFDKKQPAPSVDFIHSLPTTVSLKQTPTTRNPRSTVGTLANISNSLRALYATEGVPHYPLTGEVTRAYSPRDLAERLLCLQKGTEVEVRLPRLAVSNSKHNTYNLSQWTETQHHLFVIGEKEPSELASVLHQAFEIGGGFLNIILPKNTSQDVFFPPFKGPRHPVSNTLDPSAFSFNTASGACETCLGLGTLWLAHPDLVVVHKDQPLKARPFAGQAFPVSNWSDGILQELSKAYGFDMSCPYIDLPEYVKDLLMNGTEDHIHRVDGQYQGLGHTFEGLLDRVNARHAKLASDSVDQTQLQSIRKLMRPETCHHCCGTRIKTQRKYITLQGVDYQTACNFTLKQFKAFLDSLSNELQLKNRVLVAKISMRVSSLINLGLGYLSLNQPAASLAGGEAQRIRISSLTGEGLVNMLYVLDEPSIGLHPNDKKKVIDVISQLCSKGNTVLAIEHDEQIIRSADHLIELGPGAGVYGGQVVAAGTIENLSSSPDSKTGGFLSGNSTIPLPVERKKPSDQKIQVLGAHEYNLKNIDITIPLGMFVCVTGTSGSGKTTLIHDILGNALLAKYRNKSIQQGKCNSILGYQHLDDVAIIDQTPIGKSSRSNPATYCGFFEHIRSTFEQEGRKIKDKLFRNSHFSFNTKEGRCATCRGIGTLKINLPFLQDIEKRCPACDGQRFKPEILGVKHQNKSILDVLNMTIQEGLEFFEESNTLSHKLHFLQRLGLGYLKIGHPASDLSGGEAQRVKLANELSKLKPNKKILYILDEPTTGLHLADICTLLDALNMLIDQGHSVVVIEHHLDIIKSADYLIDLGPGGGPKGGEVMATGTPEQVMKSARSITGSYLKEYLKG